MRITSGKYREFDSKKIVATLLKYCLRPQLSGDEWQTLLIAAPSVPEILSPLLRLTSPMLRALSRRRMSWARMYRTHLLDLPFSCRCRSSLIVNILLVPIVAETLDNPPTAAAPDPVRGPVCACARPRDQGIGRVGFKGSEPAFAWKESGKPFRKNHPSSPDRDSNLDLPSSAVELNTTGALANYANEAVGFADAINIVVGLAGAINIAVGFSAAINIPVGFTAAINIVVGLAGAINIAVLLVFPKDDFNSDALWYASEKLGYECHLARTENAAVEVFESRHHDIVIVDNRYPRVMNGDKVCQNLRAAKGSKFTVIVAVVKRSLAEKDDPIVHNFLAVGYNRIFLETSSLGICMNELLTLEKSDVIPRASLAATQAFHLTLNKCSELVHITNHEHTIEFVNQAVEYHMGFPRSTMLGKNLMEMCRLEVNELMVQELQKGREWEGVITWYTRTGERLILSGRVLPFSLPGRPPSLYVYVHESPTMSEKRSSQSIVPFSQQIFQPSAAQRGSITSAGTRRQSLAKLYNLQIQAPITRIIELINSAQEEAAEPVVQILDKVIDIVRTTELYTPHMKERPIKLTDPVTSDLISALLMQGGTGTTASLTRRSSSESSAFKNPLSIPGTTKGTMYLAGSSKMKDLLDTALNWDFDIFSVEQISEKRPLVHVGMSLFLHFESHLALGCDESTLKNWLTIIELNYHSTNSYHNSSHGADVMQAAAGFLKTDRLMQTLDSLDRAICLIAAAAHDVDHPGKSSAFLCNSDSDLALLYNDLSVLESHHAALTFKLTMSDERVNIFKGLERDTYKIVRQNIIDMILATEMTRHFEHLAKFVNVFCKGGIQDEESVEAKADQMDMLAYSPENMSLIKRMLIKCADTDEEKANNLPVVMPLFDRSTCSIPKSQIGFMEFIIRDMFEAWEAFIEMPELLQYMERNYIFWKDLEERGISSIQDIIKNQRIGETGH
uniref:3',5'-cyclic-AMP phosphodiesterase n=1 Tax=Timema genevievae TaxID=629358 RepID=A0A7R9JPQ5_TIMGE|nr:unnamed protein product [Timema genevievae]